MKIYRPNVTNRKAGAMPRGVTFYSKHGKRLLDLLLTLPGLVFVFPILVTIGVFVKRRLGSPVLFRQQRPGLYGKEFTIYKFRTMTDARDASGNLLPNNERLPVLGKLLRRASLDELPELFNVLKGDLSLVGPRPLLLEYLPLYSTEQARRHDVRGGITGLAQVEGRNALDFEDRFRLDIAYVDNLGFSLDIRILIRTFIKVIKRENIIVDERDMRQRFEKSRGIST